MGRFSYARYAGLGVGWHLTHSLRSGLLSYARYAGCGLSKAGHDASRITHYTMPDSRRARRRR